MPSAAGRCPAHHLVVSSTCRPPISVRSHLGLAGFRHEQICERLIANRVENARLNLPSALRAYVAKWGRDGEYDGPNNHDDTARLVASCQSRSYVRFSQPGISGRPRCLPMGSLDPPLCSSLCDRPDHIK